MLHGILIRLLPITDKNLNNREQWHGMGQNLGSFIVISLRCFVINHANMQITELLLAEKFTSSKCASTNSDNENLLNTSKLQIKLSKNNN